MLDIDAILPIGFSRSDLSRLEATAGNTCDSHIPRNALTRIVGWRTSLHPQRRSDIRSSAKGARMSLIGRAIATPSRAKLFHEEPEASCGSAGLCPRNEGLGPIIEGRSRRRVSAVGYDLGYGEHDSARSSCARCREHAAAALARRAAGEAPGAQNGGRAQPSRPGNCARAGACEDGAKLEEQKVHYV